MNATCAIARAAPPWAGLVVAGPAGCDWFAAPPLPSGTPAPATSIRTRAVFGRAVVSERDPGTKLPKRCPELHINPDATFCLGRRSYAVHQDADLASFWQDLGEFLVNQHYAARRGRWPTGRWLSHGPRAADAQAKAEAMASVAGFEREYEACLEADEGWFAERAREPRARVAPDTPCARSCIAGTGRPSRVRHCRHRRSLQRIVTAERVRRASEEDYFNSLRRLGVMCCGRVAICRLERTDDHK